MKATPWKSPLSFIKFSCDMSPCLMVIKAGPTSPSDQDNVVVVLGNLHPSTADIRPCAVMVGGEAWLVIQVGAGVAVDVGIYHLSGGWLLAILSGSLGGWIFEQHLLAVLKQCRPDLVEVAYHPWMNAMGLSGLRHPHSHGSHLWMTISMVLCRLCVRRWFDADSSA